MNIYQGKGNNDKYHWFIYKWTLELPPKTPNNGNVIDNFKGIWNFSKNRQDIKKQSFS